MAKKPTVTPIEPTPVVVAPTVAPLTIEEIISLMNVPNEELTTKSPDLLQRVVNETPGMVPAFMTHPDFDLTTDTGLTKFNNIIWRLGDIKTNIIPKAVAHVAKVIEDARLAVERDAESSVAQAMTSHLIESGLVGADNDLYSTLNMPAGETLIVVYRYIPPTFKDDGTADAGAATSVQFNPSGLGKRPKTPTGSGTAATARKGRVKFDYNGTTYTAREMCEKFAGDAGIERNNSDIEKGHWSKVARAIAAKLGAVELAS